MKNKQQDPNKTEVQKANEDGFHLTFSFFDGQLFCNVAPTIGYFPKDVKISPRPCSINNHIVYRITTAGNLKGIAIHIPDDNQIDF